MRALHNNIRVLRKWQGLSQTAFGALFELTRGQVASYESGVEPSLHTLMQIVGKFKLDLGNFLEEPLSQEEMRIMATQQHVRQETAVLAAHASAYAKQEGNDIDQFSLSHYDRLTPAQQRNLFNELLQQVAHLSAENQTLLAKLLKAHEDKDLYMKGLLAFSRAVHK